MALVPISEVRQRDHIESNATTRVAIEMASTFSILHEFATMDAADYTAGAVLYDSEFLGGYWEQDANEGTNGTITIEKWSLVTGGVDTPISEAGVMDAGAASLEPLVALATGAEVVAAGFKINVLITGVDAAPTGRVTLFFKTVDDLGEFQ